MVESLNPLMGKLNQYEILSERMENINDKVKSLKDFMKNAEINKEQKKDDEIEEIKQQCEKSAISKLRVHADIHRFQFAKLLQQMKQKYCKHIEELQSKISALQNKFIKIQDSYSKLQTDFESQNQEKVMVESQLLSLKKSFNEEVVNYQNVQNQNKQKEQHLHDVINELRIELDEKGKYSHNIAKQNQINIKKRADIQDKLNEQSKKSKKLHTKAIKLQSELKTIKPKYNELQQTLKHIQNENKDYKLEIAQLQALNISLKEAIDTKDINNSKTNEILNNKICELKDALTNVETANNALNNKTESQYQEMKQYMEQLEILKKSNVEYQEKYETIKSERLQDERIWLEKEEDFRNEINIIRQQLHDATNDLGMMKLDTLEKETFIKKLQNEINGLNEQIMFYKECELKEKSQREILSQQITKHNKTHENKMNDIKMILDAKAVRIMRLQEDVEIKANKIKELETENIELRNEISTTKTIMNQEHSSLQTQNNENNKLQIIINDLSNELQNIKTERGKLYSELETQKNVNVQLSIELDSMQKFVDKSGITEDVDHNNNNDNDINNSILLSGKSMTDDDLNKYSNISFFDVELENPRETKSNSMPNINNINNNHRYSDIHSSDIHSSDINDDNNLDKFYRKRPSLPIPQHSSSQSSSSQLPIRNRYGGHHSFFDGNAEEEEDHDL